MKYDPIMCMMVDDSVKTKDTVSNVKVGNKYKINGKEYKVIRANISQNIVSLLSDNFERLDMKFDEFIKKANDSVDKSIDKAIRSCDSRVSTRNVVTSNIAFEEIKKMTGIIPEKVKQKGDTMEFYHSGVKVAEWDMNNAEVKVFV